MSIKSVHCMFLGSIWSKRETKPSHNHPLDLLLLCVTQSSHIPSEPQIFPSKGAGGRPQPPPLIPSPVSREQTCKGCTHCNGLCTSPPSYSGQRGAGECWHSSSHPSPGQDTPMHYAGTHGPFGRTGRWPRCVQSKQQAVARGTVEPCPLASPPPALHGSVQGCSRCRFSHVQGASR